MERERPRTRIHTERLDLRRQWEENAPAWIRWAREPGHDSYWRFHRDRFLSLLPEPGAATLDVGCGEGRVSRDLRSLGHRVVALDASPTMAEAAKDADPTLPVVVGDAAALPLADASFDLVIGFMSLQDVDDLSGALHEAARVLVPGGRLCMAVVHPLNSSGTFEEREADSPFVIAGSYLDPIRYVDEMERDGLAMRFASAHLPVEGYVGAVTDAGFLLEDLREPAVPDDAYPDGSGRRWQRIPLFLHLRAVKR